jgi:hypothetical protein
MNSRARGVSVRFFKVMVPIGIRELGNATGNALSGGSRPGTRSIMETRASLALSVERLESLEDRPERCDRASDNPEDSQWTGGHF